MKNNMLFRSARFATTLERLNDSRSKGGLERKIGEAISQLGLGGYALVIRQDAEASAEDQQHETVDIMVMDIGERESDAAELDPDDVLPFLGPAEEPQIFPLSRSQTGTSNDPDAATDLLGRLGVPSGCVVSVAQSASTTAALLVLSNTDETADAFMERLPDLEPSLRLLAAALERPVGHVLMSSETVALTRAERDILEKLAEGMRPAAIALARGRSETTVRNQIARIHRRLSVTTDTEAIGVAYRLGLI